MRSRSLLLLLLGVSLSAHAASGVRRRFAVIVGANDGGTGRMLRHAVSDARGFADVMSTLGGITPSDQTVLENPGPAELRATLVAVAQSVAQARAEGGAPELVFYYSGHSDEEGLLLKGKRVSYSDLRGLLQTVPATFRVTVLDSCSSGSFTRSKGGTPVVPFLIDRSTEVKGDAILTSSTATEASQESDRLGSSFFTHHLLSGLRGAADISRDGKVTLNEVYQFAFNETLARTERTRAGAQHPSYDMAVAGTGDVVLSDLRGTTAGLIIPETMSGHLFIRNGHGALTVELRKAAGAAVQLALEPGTYEVTLVQGNQVLGGTATVQLGTPVVLDGRDLRALPSELNPLRGEAAEASVGLRLWHGEVRLVNGIDLSGAPTAGLGPQLFGFGASYFIRPLHDDRITPFPLLRFFQRPDELSVSIAGTGWDSRGLFFRPQLDLGAAVYPWSFLGFSAGVGLNGTVSGELGYRARASVVGFPLPTLRVFASVVTDRSQSPYVGATGSLLDGFNRTGASSTNAISAGVEWIRGYRWRFTADYSFRFDNTDGYGSVATHSGSLGVTYYFGRQLALGVTVGVLSHLPGRRSTDPFGGGPMRSYDLVILPEVQWFILDWLSVHAVLGPTLTFYPLRGFPLAPPVFGLAPTLNLNARF